jgi:glycine cleavage system regulatory protein
MAQTRLVLTLAAADQPGLVGMIATVIRSHGGNWVDSAITRLAGAIAGIVEVDIDPSAHAALLSTLGDLDMVTVSPVTVPPGIQASIDDRASSGQRASMVLSCVDRSGIVADLAAALAATGAVFETLETGTEHGSMSGEMMFSAKSIVWLPDGVTPQILTEACEALSGDLMADIDTLADPIRPSVTA